MLRKFRLLVAIAVALTSSLSESFAAAASGAKSHVQRNHHLGFDAGYRAGYARGYRQAANTLNTNPGLVPVEMFGIQVYRANPCYQYNDRDWDFEKVC
jgi:hypothetical protein